MGGCSQGKHSHYRLCPIALTQRARHFRKVYSDAIKKLSPNSAYWGGLGYQAHFPTSWDWHLTLSFTIYIFPGCFTKQAILAVNGHGRDLEMTEEKGQRNKIRTRLLGHLHLLRSIPASWERGKYNQGGKVRGVSKSTNYQWPHNSYLEKKFFFSFQLISHTSEKSPNIRNTELRVA